MAVSKSNIVRSVSKDLGWTLKKSRHTVDVLLDIIKNTLQTHEQIAIRGFGKFFIQHRKARRLRHPASGRIIQVPPKRVVGFKSFKGLRDKINADPTFLNVSDLYKPTRPPARKNRFTSANLKKHLTDYKIWIESEGLNGKAIDFSLAKLANTDLYAAYLSRVNFKCADLEGADLSDADLYEANLQGANLRGAILAWANLDGAQLQRASLERADLRWANLEGANLTAANLRWANLEGANLKGVKLNEANIYGAKLNNTDMQGTNFTGIKLDPDTSFNLPKTILQKYSHTFVVSEWEPN